MHGKILSNYKTIHNQPKWVKEHKTQRENYLHCLECSGQRTERIIEGMNNSPEQQINARPNNHITQLLNGDTPDPQVTNSLKNPSQIITNPNIINPLPVRHKIKHLTFIRVSTINSASDSRTDPATSSEKIVTREGWYSMNPRHLRDCAALRNKDEKGLGYLVNFEEESLISWAYISSSWQWMSERRTGMRGGEETERAAIDDGSFAARRWMWRRLE